MAQKQNQQRLQQANQGRPFIPPQDDTVQVAVAPRQRGQVAPTARPTVAGRPVQRPGQPPVQRPAHQAVAAAWQEPEDQYEDAPQYAPPVMGTAQRVVDERYQEVFLPSKFLPYSFKRIMIRQLTRGEIKAVIRAKASGSHRHLIQAVDQTIDQDVYDLTIGDFWYLMYWHRINSYKRTPFNVTWKCTHEPHIQRVNLAKTDKGHLDEKTLENQLVINKSNLQEIVIDEAKYTDVAQRLLGEYGLRVTPQTVRDFIAILEAEEQDTLMQQAKQQKLGQVDVVEDDEKLMALLYEIQEEVADVEVRMYGYRYAALLSTQHGETLEERDAFLDTLDPEIDIMLEEFLSVAEHGVSELFKVTCGECSASKEVKSSLDALSFLPAYDVGDRA